MSTHKYIDRICCVAIVLSLLLTILFMNGAALGVVVKENNLDYEDRIFDTSKVHTIDIIMDESDWNTMIDNALSEEYTLCTLVIDDETFGNVAIRPKGNTSLSKVADYGNDRYSFKIEFDHYNSDSTYHGLDKLSLNNIIQDNTYMKDYLCYEMMDYFGVDSPLCSYTWITVNGEDWGLYLAVEAVEDAFLERNYNSTTDGCLYKPDSMSMGGGRGNGGDFDMDDWQDQNTQTDQDNQDSQNTKTAPNSTTTDGNTASIGTAAGGSGNMPTMPGGDSSGGNMPTMPGGDSSDGNTPSMPDGDSFDGNMPSMPDGDSFDGNMPTMPDGDSFSGGDKGGGGMSADDVALVYTDDDYDSYSNIFDNAKTNIKNKDKARLIASIKDMNNCENLEEVVDIDEVIRYFVVHNFVVNFDSYTGSMIHNYYLYEENGQMSMIPWDYNLAFGGFVSGSDATSLINYPIDTPVSGGTVDSRPMLAWIFSDDSYTDMYHEYFAEFISECFDSGYFATMIDEVTDLISPYVEKDPTKFCTTEEFEKGVATLKSFCTLRAKSITGQLNGTIPATDTEQAADDTALVDGSALTISDMGTMGSGGGGMGDSRGGDKNSTQKTDDTTQGKTDGTANDDTQTTPQGESTSPPSGDKESGDSTEKNDSTMDQNKDGTTPPDSGDIQGAQGNSGSTSPGDSRGVSGSSGSAVILMIISLVLLAGGLIFAKLYKKKV